MFYRDQPEFTLLYDDLPEAHIVIWRTTCVTHCPMEADLCHTLLYVGIPVACIALRRPSLVYIALWRPTKYKHCHMKAYCGTHY